MISSLIMKIQYYLIAHYLNNETINDFDKILILVLIFTSIMF